MFKNIEQALIQHYEAYANKTLFIAYSGGVDSQVLLHATAQLIKKQIIKNSLAVCHIHHGLSENADEWLHFAKKQSETYQASFYYQKVTLTLSKQKSLEALARDARYQALTEMTSEHDILVTGHHGDDQAETFLLALKRGSGLAGLSAMSIKTRLNQRLLIRPLLRISREEIEQYAYHYQLSWVNDESNKDNVYDRNFLRNNVLPTLTERWPAIKKTINRSAEHCQDAVALIAEITDADFKSCLNDETNDIKNHNRVHVDKLSIPKLLALSIVRFNYVIRYFLKLHSGLMPSKQQLIQLHEQLNAAEDKTPEIKMGSLWLRRYKNEIYVTQELSDVSDWTQPISLSNLIDTVPLTIDLPDNLGKATIIKHSNIDDENIHTVTELNLNNGIKRLYFSLPIENTLTLSFTHSNPLCLPEFRHKRRALKKVLQELNIPPWQRKRQLFIFDNCQLVGIAGRFVCQPYLCHSSMNKTSKKASNDIKSSYLAKGLQCFSLEINRI